VSVLEGYRAPDILQPIMRDLPKDIGPLTTAHPHVPPAFFTAPGRVEAVELYRVDCTKPRHFSFGTWHNRQHLVVRLRCGALSGWGEMIVGKNEPTLDVAQKGAAFGELAGLSVPAAIAHVRAAIGRWGENQTEIAEMALIDLAGRLLDRPSVDLLGLRGTAPVPGLYCILDGRPDHVRAEARTALEQTLRTHLKVKLFGDPAKDEAVIRAARDVYGPDAYIVGDVNGGYHAASLPALAINLLRLRAAGLSACEDPANMTNADWVSLQASVGDLDLVPDAPVKNAARALATLLPGMGRVYNIHPANTGSIFDAVQLGRKIQSLGAKLMIGDDSLLGPACAGWTQLAVGLGADWVEAIDKPQECDAFLNCVTRTPVGRTVDGRFEVAVPAPGFGLEVDVDALKVASSQVHVMR
jgi:L-alanine-DL-glutamate epimerase-like enolase superfamily enzyme